MKKGNEDFIITKIERNKPFILKSIDFERFQNLHLSKLENKKKIKPQKRREAFNYKIFHEKDLARLKKFTPTNVVTLSSPPSTKKSTKKPNSKVFKAPSPPSSISDGFLSEEFVGLKSPNSESNIKILSLTTVKSRVITPLVVKSPFKILTPIIVKSPVKSPVSTPIIVKSPVKSPVSTPIIVKSPVKSPVSTPIIVKSPVKSPVSTPIIVKSPVKSPLKISTPIIVKSPVQSPSAIVKSIRPRTLVITPSDICTVRSNYPNAIQKSIGSLKTRNSSFRSSYYTQTKKDMSNFMKTLEDKKYKNQSFSSDIVSVTSVKNVHSVSTNFSNEEEEKIDLLFKFQILHSKHPTLISRDSFNMRSDLKVMRNTYKMIIKQLAVNNKVVSMNTYLLAGFMVFEYSLGKLGFDMEGFSKQQMSSMKTYEALLIELGEKEYSLGGMDKWSVEVRLATTLLFNAFWFVLAKSISKDNTVMNLFFASTREETPIVNKPLINNREKKRMKGFCSK